MGRTIKTVGLSEHYPKNVSVHKEELKSDKVYMALTKEQKEKVAQVDQDSLFRLVSTGVNVDNRIKVATAVQIQHYESKLFLSLDNAKFTDNHSQMLAEQSSPVKGESSGSSNKNEETKAGREMSISEIREAAMIVKQKTRMSVANALN